MKSIINDQAEYDSTRKSLKHRDTTIILSASTARLLELFGNDSNLLIVFYVQIMPDDLVMQLHRF